MFLAWLSVRFAHVYQSLFRSGPAAATHTTTVAVLAATALHRLMTLVQPVPALIDSISPMQSSISCMLVGHRAGPRRPRGHLTDTIDRHVLV